MLLANLLAITTLTPNNNIPNKTIAKIINK